VSENLAFDGDLLRESPQLYLHRAVDHPRLGDTLESESLRVMRNRLAEEGSGLSEERALLYHLNGCTGFLFPVVSPLDGRPPQMKLVFHRLAPNVPGPRTLMFELIGSESSSGAFNPSTINQVRVSSASGRNSVVFQTSAQSPRLRKRVERFEFEDEEEDDGFWGSIWSFFEGIGEAIADVFSWLWDRIKDIAGELWEEAKTLAIKVFLLDEDGNRIPPWDYENAKGFEVQKTLEF
jgi:hypothetical protein